MANCPNCGTWNPDDKRVCWRCQSPLPKPEPEKPRRAVYFLGLPMWVWLILVAFFLFNLLLPTLVNLLQP